MPGARSVGEIEWRCGGFTLPCRELALPLVHLAHRDQAGARGTMQLSDWPRSLALTAQGILMRKRGAYLAQRGRGRSIHCFLDYTRELFGWQ